MNIFWSNTLKLSRFFISVILGFSLTVFRSIFKVLKNPQKSLFTITSTTLSFIFLVWILEKMLALD